MMKHSVAVFIALISIAFGDKNQAFGGEFLTIVLGIWTQPWRKVVI